MGQVVSQKQKTPVRETVKKIFGKVGSVVKYIAQQTVIRHVPQPVRTAIKTGIQKVGRAAVSVVKAGATKLVGAVKSLAEKIFGGRR